MRTNTQQSVITDCCVLFSRYNSLDSSSKFYSENDAKRRLTKVGLNGNAEYLTYAYEEDVTEDGILSDKTVVTNAKDETFTSFTDKRGNVRKMLYGSTPQVTSTYDAKTV